MCDKKTVLGTGFAEVLFINDKLHDKKTVFLE